jgi:GTP cyclohydrolase I
MPDDHMVKVEQHVRGLLSLLDVDWSDDNFTDTPARYAKWIAPMAQRADADEIKKILGVTFQEEHEELVMVTNIRFEALCAHHLLPFTGVAHVGYIPMLGVVGISKLARVVQYVANRMTLQERVTKEVADALETYLQPQGAMIVVRSRHSCMSIRGVREPYAETVTSAVRGVFAHNANGCKDEFLSLIPKTTGGM